LFFFSNYSESYHFDGVVISDCDAVDTIISGHHYTSTVEDTVAVALHAGTDIDCGSFYAKHTQQALDNKTIVEADIDQALERAFNVLIRLGYFDPPEQQPYRHITKDEVDTAESRQLALEAAEQSIVLLKNIDKSLPLDLNQLQNKRIALIGPNANVSRLMQGNYYGTAPFLIDPRTAFERIAQGNNDSLMSFDFSFFSLSLLFKIIRSMFHSFVDVKSLVIMKVTLQRLLN
jgi:beta-D-xylosidase 4